MSRRPTVLETFPIVFLEQKAHFLGSKTVDQCSGAILKKPVFLLKFAGNLLKFNAFLGFLQQKR